MRAPQRTNGVETASRHTNTLSSNVAQCPQCGAGADIIERGVTVDAFPHPIAWIPVLHECPYGCLLSENEFPEDYPGHPPYRRALARAVPQPFTRWQGLCTVSQTEGTGGHS